MLSNHLSYSNKKIANCNIMFYSNSMQNFESNQSTSIAEELTYEEISILEQNGGKVLSPVLVREFENIDDFKQNSNNFYLFFMDLPEGYIKNAYKCRGAYKRFKYLFADLHDSLNNQLSVPMSEETNEQKIESAFDAYTIMARLVDEYDENAMTDGKANENTLVQ